LSICLACHATIVWAKDLITNRPRPLDPEPHTDDSGHIAARTDGIRWECYSISQTRPLREGFQTFTGHHASCPNWKKPDQPPQKETLF
jgi:hypothetical protein